MTRQLLKCQMPRRGASAHRCVAPPAAHALLEESRKDPATRHRCRPARTAHRCSNDAGRSPSRARTRCTKDRHAAARAARTGRHGCRDARGSDRLALQRPAAAQDCGPIENSPFHLLLLVTSRQNLIASGEQAGHAVGGGSNCEYCCARRGRVNRAATPRVVRCRRGWRPSLTADTTRSSGSAGRSNGAARAGNGGPGGAWGEFSVALALPSVLTADKERQRFPREGLRSRRQRHRTGDDT